MNENYPMPAMPGDVREGILKGMYRFRAAENKESKLRAQLFGSGAILNEALKAQDILAEKYGVAADVWSVTSYKALYMDGNETDRWNRLHPAEKPRVPYVTELLKDAPGVLVAATDYLKTLPNMVSSGCRGGWLLWGLMGSDAAKGGRRCGISSRSMQGSLCGDAERVVPGWED